MNSIERRYAEFDSNFLLVNKTARGEVVKMTVLYLMRAVTSQEYSDHVRKATEWSGKTMAEFRNELKFWGYIQRDFKFYLYEALVDGTFLLSSRIFKEDRQFVQRFIKADDPYAEALRAQCTAYKRLGYVARNLNVFSKKCEDLVEDLDTSCKKFVLKSLKFVVQQNAMTIQDMVNELMSYGIYAIYRAYPEIKNNLHMLNIARQAAHNRGENIIKEATTISRSRLTKNEDGTFSAKVISLHADGLGADYGTSGGPVSGGMMVCTSLMVGLDGKSVENESGADVDRRRDLCEAVTRIATQRLIGDKSQKFMELLMGVYDPVFSTWLGQENDELFDTVTRQEYAEKIRTYLGVSVEKAQSFVRGLRTELADFRN